MIVKEQRMCVPEYGELKRDIMEEAHSSAYAMHPGSTKMYKTLKACGEDILTPYSSMEIGEDHYGFCDRSSMDSEAA